MTVDIIEQARKNRAIIEGQSQTMPEKDVSQLPWMCPRLHGDGALVKAGTRIQWEGQVLKAGAALWDRPENWPDKAPTLWEALPYKDGYRIIPQTITVTGAFGKGERGWWGDGLWESLVANNVYTPAQYRRNWKQVQ